MRKERKKWKKLCTQVDAIWFVFSLTDFSMVCYEDYTVNRMNDDLALFGEWINSKELEKPRIELVFSRKDQFKELLQKEASLSILKSLLPTLDETRVLESISDRFLELDREKRVKAVHYVNIIDRGDVESLLDKGINTLVSERF